MNELISPRSRLFVAWIVLCVMTLFAWWVGIRQDETLLQPQAMVGLSAMAITLIKVRIIVREFMDVKEAPAKLKRITDLWLVLFIAAMAIVYFAFG